MKRQIVLYLLALMIIANNGKPCAAGCKGKCFEFAPSEFAESAGFKYLINPVGGRGAALGGAYMTLANDASAVFYNPAALADVPAGSLVLDATNHTNRLNYYAGAVAWRWDNIGVFSVHALIQDYSNNKHESVVLNPITGKFLEGRPYSYEGAAAGVSYARALADHLTVGGGVKWAYMDYNDEAYAQVVGTDENGNPAVIEEVSLGDSRRDIPVFDFGVLYDTGMKGLRIGAALMNLSQDDDAEGYNLPKTVKVGASADLLDLLNIEHAMNRHNAMIAAEISRSRSYAEGNFGFFANVGTEYRYRNTLSLRLGYKANYEQENFTFGAGVRTPGFSHQLHVDYAFNGYSDWEAAHKFSVGLEF